MWHQKKKGGGCRCRFAALRGGRVMVLNITCQGSCRFINNTETCTSFPGCEWYLPSPNTTEHVVAPGYCGPNSAQTYGSTGWIGVFLALLGGVFIK